MKKNGRRLGRVVWWGVYACCMAVVIVFIASFFYRVSGFYIRSNNRSASTGIRIEAGLSWGRISFLYESASPFKEPVAWPVGMVHKEFNVSRYHRPLPNTFHTPQPVSWWWPPKGVPEKHLHFIGVETLWSIPLAYIVIPLLVISLRMYFMKRWNMKMVNHCGQCGYSLEGLTSNACPECGVERG